MVHTSVNFNSSNGTPEPTGSAKQKSAQDAGADTHANRSKKPIPPRPSYPDLDPEAEAPSLHKKNVEANMPLSEEAARSYEVSKKVLGTKSIHDLYEVFSQEHHRFDPTNLIAAIKHLGDLRGKRVPDGKGEISVLAENLVRDLNVQLAKFSPEDLAKVLHLVANIADIIKPEQLTLLSGSLESALKQQGFTIKSVATLSQSLSTLDPENNKLFDQLAAMVLRAPKQSASPIDLVALTSAFCPRVPCNKKLIEQLAGLVKSKSQEFTPDQLADLIHAFDSVRSRLFYEHTIPLFETLAKSATSKIGFFSPMQLAEMTRAMAHFELDREQAQPVLQSELQKAGAQNGFDMRTTFFGAAANAVLQHKGIFSARSLCDLAFTFAKMSINNPQLMAHLANKMLEKQRGKPPVADSMRKDQLWRTLWAFATVGVAQKPLMDRLIARSKQIAKELDNTCIGNILWSLAILDMRPDLPTSQSLVDAFAGSNPKEISIRQAFAFYQHSTLPHSEGDYPLKWPAQLVAKFDALKIGDVNITKLQSEVYAEVKKLHPEAVEERPIRKMPVDIAIKKVVHGKKVKVAIEIDGPTHFAYKSHEPLGHTQFKRRLLNRKGWQAVSVPYWDWDAIQPKDLQAKAAYLKSILPTEALQNRPENDQPKVSKSAMKKARRAARAQAAAAAAERKKTAAQTDEEKYFSFDDRDEPVESDEFDSAVSSKEEKKQGNADTSGASPESGDEGYHTANDS